MRESVVENHLVKRVTETGGFVRKVVWPGVRGAPDRLVGWPSREQIDVYFAEGMITLPRKPGLHALIEMKRPKKGAEAHQRREHERLRAIGFDVRVLDTIEAVNKFVEEMTS